MLATVLARASTRPQLPRAHFSAAPKRTNNTRSAPNTASNSRRRLRRSAPTPSQIPVRRNARRPTAATAAGAPSHHDLASFLAYAGSTGLSRSSSVYRGTYYEYLVARSLARYGFALQRTGGAHDAGIDLAGTWRVPAAPVPLRVLLQCKAVRAGVGPESVRELEGAVAAQSGAMAWLVGMVPASRGVRDAVQRAGVPMGFCQCDSEGTVKQMVWNHRAREEGLEGLGVTVRYATGAEGKGVNEEIGLTWEGQLIRSEVEAEEIDGKAKKRIRRTRSTSTDLLDEEDNAESGTPAAFDKPKTRRGRPPRKELEK